jgi:hypothetical protein
MPIQDTNSERRNLVVVSLAFIIFVAAGGKVVTPGVRLLLLDVRFENADVLVAFAWILLFWSAWRYWLTNRGGAKERFTREMHQNVRSRWVLKYLEQCTGERTHVEGGVMPVSLSREGWPWVIEYMKIQEWNLDPGENLRLSPTPKEIPRRWSR